MKRLYTLFAIVFGPYFAAVIYLGASDQGYIRDSLPWVHRVMALYFFAGIATLAIWGRPKGSPEFSQPSRSDIAKLRRISRWGPVLYVLVLINTISAVVRGDIPLKMAAPGLIVIALMIGAFWRIGTKIRSSGNDGKGK